MRCGLAMLITTSWFSVAGCSGDSGAPATPDSGGAREGSSDAGGTPPADAGAEHVSSALAAEAYIWGYPLVVSQRTMQTFGSLGVNHLLNASTLAAGSSRTIVSPNQDTLYSVAVLDLRGGPVVLTVPDVTDRYWTYQFLDPWTDSVHYIGTRATSGRGGSFAITPPDFTGALPDGVDRIASPTPEMFLLGRYLVRDAADVANVTVLERTLAPLSDLTGEPAPPPPPAQGAAAGSPQEVGAEGAAFFDELGDALAIHPPVTDADKTHLARFAVLGIGPGLHPAEQARASDAAMLAVLERGVRDGDARIVAAAEDDTGAVNGWCAHLDIGVYDDDPLLRAAIAKVLWGAHVPQEAVYAEARVDPATGLPLTGAGEYIVHFDADNLPPVKTDGGFWSLSLYGPDHFFVDNAIDRYAIGDRTPGLTYNADGSLDIYVQHDAPEGHEDNWLPAPGVEFRLLLRLVLPKAAVLDGRYEYPSISPN